MSKEVKIEDVLSSFEYKCIDYLIESLNDSYRDPMAAQTVRNDGHFIIDTHFVKEDGLKMYFILSHVGENIPHNLILIKQESIITVDNYRKALKQVYRGILRYILFAKKHIWKADEGILLVIIPVQDLIRLGYTTELDKEIKNYKDGI